MRKELKFFTFVAVIVCAMLPRSAHAQVATTARTWNTVAGYLGIENLRCDCTLAIGREGVPRNFVFRSEPVITGVADGSPGDGLLEDGDIITQIDGISLLTQEGGRRFAAIAPGDDVRLTIKRDGRTMHVALRAGQAMGRRMYGLIAPEAGVPRAPVIAWTVPPEPAIPAAPATAPAPPSRGVASTVATPRAPAVRGVVGGGIAGVVAPAVPAPGAVAAGVTTPAIPAMPSVPVSPATPRAWFGFSIRCNDCGWSRAPGQDPVWESEVEPEILMISSEGPAHRAGLLTGDKIIAVDGYSILSREGARRFGSVRPGQTIRLTVRRGNATVIRPLTLARRPEEVAAIAVARPRAATTPAPTRRELRYNGKIDNVTVQVWSVGGPTVEKVGDEMVITVAGSVVRIKVDPKK